MKKTTIISVIGIVLALAIAWTLGVFTPASERGKLPADKAAALVRMHAPALGAPSAGVTLTEFLDPACSACAAFYPIVKKILSDSDGKLRLVVRYAPFHRGSDQAVLALEAARKQGKYWPALEALMASQASWVQNHTVVAERIWPVLQQAGVDVAQAQKDAQDPKLQAQLEQDMVDLKLLEIAKTPTFFVNDRELQEFGVEPLQALIKEEIAASYK
jgi:protein-disulfide isomerase